MKTFSNVAFQGDVSIIRASQVGVKSLPKNAQEIKPEKNGRLIVTHSETGHHHFVQKSEARFYGTDDPNICYLVVEGKYADLVHDRQTQQHETLRIPNGLYQINRQVEKRPEGWRRVED